MTINELHSDLSGVCEQIANLFKQPVKVSIVIRMPSISDSDIFCSNDDIDDLIEALRKLKGQPDIILEKTKGLLN